MLFVSSSSFVFRVLFDVQTTHIWVKHCFYRRLDSSHGQGVCRHWPPQAWMKSLQLYFTSHHPIRFLQELRSLGRKKLFVSWTWDKKVDSSEFILTWKKKGRKLNSTYNRTLSKDVTAHLFFLLVFATYCTLRNDKCFSVRNRIWKLQNCAYRGTLFWCTYHNN